MFSQQEMRTLLNTQLVVSREYAHLFMQVEEELHRSLKAPAVESKARQAPLCRPRIPRYQIFPGSLSAIIFFKKLTIGIYLTNETDFGCHTMKRFEEASRLLFMFTPGKRDVHTSKTSAMAWMILACDASPAFQFLTRAWHSAALQV